MLPQINKHPGRPKTLSALGSNESLKWRQVSKSKLMVHFLVPYEGDGKFWLSTRILTIAFVPILLFVHVIDSMAYDKFLFSMEGRPICSLCMKIVLSKSFHVLL